MSAKRGCGADHTATEIQEAVQQGRTVVASYDNTYYQLLRFESENIATFYIVLNNKYCYLNVSTYSSGTLVSYEDYNIEDNSGVYLPLSGGTMTGALTLSGAPTADLHAATKKYVDDNKGTSVFLKDWAQLPSSSAVGDIYLLYEGE